MEVIKMKKFIQNKKIMITFISCLVVIVLVFIGITAMRMVAKNSSIGVEAAKKFAYIDAGVKEKNVNDVDVDFEYKDSTYVYCVDFDTDKKDYHYYVNASNGIILEKKIVKKKKSGSSKEDKKKSKKKKRKRSGNQSDSSEKYSSGGKKIQETTKKVKSKKDDEDDADVVIGMDRAKSIAVSSAGVSMSDAVFTLAVLDGDTYNLQFYVGNTEYNYSIDAFTGSVDSAYSNDYEGSDAE